MLLLACKSECCLLLFYSFLVIVVLLIFGLFFVAVISLSLLFFFFFVVFEASMQSSMLRSLRFSFLDTSENCNFFILTKTSQSIWNFLNYWGVFSRLSWGNLACVFYISPLSPPPGVGRVAWGGVSLLGLVCCVVVT